jgi:predicted nucleic acid-binding protein
MFVVDASIALAWCFEDEATPLTESVLQQLGQGAATAPAIWPLEIANGLRSAERRGRIQEQELPRLTGLLSALPIEVEGTSLATALGDVRPLARSLLLSAYDASYLALAIRRGLPLATADEQLARAALAAGVVLVEPTAGPLE